MFKKFEIYYNSYFVITNNLLNHHHQSIQLLFKAAHVLQLILQKVTIIKDYKANHLLNFQIHLLWHHPYSKNLHHYFTINFQDSRQSHLGISYRPISHLLILFSYGDVSNFFLNLVTMPSKVLHLQHHVTTTAVSLATSNHLLFRHQFCECPIRFLPKPFYLKKQVFEYQCELVLIHSQSFFISNLHYCCNFSTWDFWKPCFENLTYLMLWFWKSIYLTDFWLEQGVSKVTFLVVH